MFKESNSLSSTNLPETIGLTIFGGTGEKPCNTTNDCCRTGRFGRENGTRGEKTLPRRWERRSDGRYQRRKSWHKERDNKVWPTLQLVNQSDVGNRNWWETKIWSSQIQGLRMQTGHERRRNAPSHALGFRNVHCRRSLCGCERLFNSRDHGGQKDKERHVRNASQMRWAPKHRSQKEEELPGWHPFSKWAVVNPAAKTGRKAVICDTLRHAASKKRRAG